MRHASVYKIYPLNHLIHIFIETDVKCQNSHMHQQYDFLLLRDMATRLISI